MSKKIFSKGEVISVTPVLPGIYSIWLRTEGALLSAPGQFFNFYPNDSAHLLPRPISICEIDRRKRALRFVFRVKGEGTVALSLMKSGDTIDLMGPLGNGFPMNIPERNAILIGGGIGVPPMLELAREFPGRSKVVLGFTDEPFLVEDFSNTDSDVYVATENGNQGTRGNVVGAIMENNLGADVIYACGPKAMLSAVKMLARVRKIRCFVSLEEHMACGIGACLGCVVGSKEEDPHFNVKKKRICADGPVFDASEVDLT